MILERDRLAVEPGERIAGRVLALRDAAAELSAQLGSIAQGPTDNGSVALVTNDKNVRRRRDRRQDA